MRLRLSDWVTVAREDELASGEWRVVDVDDARIAVFNLDGEFHAIEDVCTIRIHKLRGVRKEPPKRPSPGLRIPL